MDTFSDLENKFKKEKINLIVVADAEPVVTIRKDHITSTYIPAGGVAVALEPLARATNAVYIARAKQGEEKIINPGKIKIRSGENFYDLKHLFLSDKEMKGYYYGFANQTLWPMMHVAFEEPIFHNEWYNQYKKVNIKFAQSIQEEIKKDSVIWINDYQLALVPSFLKRSKSQSVGFFWHIPWPTWEIFRILPQKKEILESLLLCDFIGFHRGYQVENFLQTVERELEARIDRERKLVFYKNHITNVENLPMGIDVDVVKKLAKGNQPEITKEKKGVVEFIRSIFLKKTKIEIPSKELPYKNLFKKYNVILGVDRLDYTKGLRKRLEAIDRLFKKYPKYRGKVVYIGILSPSREEIPAYRQLKIDIYRLAGEINKKFRASNWKPVYLLSQVLSRENLMQLYKKAEVCLVTPLDDGMNLVSKEYVCATSQSESPGMIVLSQFAGSAIDLTEGLIVNPYDKRNVAVAIDAALSMPEKERKERIYMMEETLDERNVYNWIDRFITSTKEASRQNRKKN